MQVNIYNPYMGQRFKKAAKDDMYLSWNDRKTWQPAKIILTNKNMYINKRKT